MRRIGTIWSTALVLFMGMFAMLQPTLAHAQTGDTSDQVPELSTDWSIRVGLYISQSKATRAASGEVGFSGNVERRVYAGRGYDINIGIGYNGMDAIYTVPITANLIAYKDNIRYGFGLGYAFGKRINSRGTSGTVFDLLLGYQLTRGRNPLSLDLRYFFIGGSENELDGYSLTLGMKF